MSKSLKINEEYLGELITYNSKALVGKILKRFEILGNKEAVKSATKELIYEQFREFRNLILAHDKGLNMTIFKFETPKKDNSTQK